MLTVLSLVTSVKDYIEIAHKLIESQSGNFLFPQPYIDMVGVQNAAALNLDKQTGGASLFAFNNYTELGAVLTYIVLSIKEFLTSFFSFTWLNQIWSLPLIVPDIASAMISEVSVLDSYFTNAFSFLETGLSTSSLNVAELKSVTTENTFVYAFEKFITGFINSLFLVLPTSTAHLITLRRFVIQGLEAGYIAGLGTIAGNVLWLASIILGWRFIVIPWLSFDIFRYILGFSLLVKYLWDSSKEFNKTSGAVLEDNTKKNIFVLNFLLALTEQTSIYPFISNISFGPEGSILESFSGTISQSYANANVLNSVNSTVGSLEFLTIHGCYLLGIVLGCFSLLQFTVWFWENPAFSIYMWMITSYRVTTSSYYKVLNFIFLYLTMLCAISSIPYFGLDYTLTNPLGLIPQDRIIDQKFTTANGPGDKILQETAFLGVNPTDKNTRIRDGMHARRERWKERLIKYQAFDASLYDQGTYDILTIEDLNYGFERFWLRRKLRNHQIRFRLFPGPWMRSLKKQLNKPGFSGPRVEFFRILFEQYYHPIFHSKVTTISNNKQTSKPKSYAELATSNGQKSLFLTNSSSTTNAELANSSSLIQENFSKNLETNVNINNKLKLKKGLVGSSVAQTSALRKFSRNFNNRLNSSLTVRNLKTPLEGNLENSKYIYSKSLKYLFNRITNQPSSQYTISKLGRFDGWSKENNNLFRNISRNMLLNQTTGVAQPPASTNLNILVRSAAKPYNILWSNKTQNGGSFYRADWISLKKTNIRKKLSKKERVLLTLKTAMQNPNTLSTNQSTTDPTSLTKAIRGRPFGASLEPLKYYLQKDEALKRKFKYYSTTVSRNLSVGNNAPYFKTMLKRAFYYHKPSLRWKRTMFTATMRRGFRKKSSSPKKLVYPSSTLTLEATNPQTLSAKNVNTESPVAELYVNTVFSDQAAALQNPIYTKTASYSVLGKRASRYRYQIYKDVLQHWYYSPFNRLLLKFDIDSFINRQPKTHFLTKKEERLLHLRRVLLSEHYNSLRWYTYMQHYNTMKSQIGSTKSFSSTVYKQQFQGTFKKIRHLFAITPSQGQRSFDMPVLQFDQPLYTEVNRSLPANTSSVSERSSKFTKFNLLPIYLHEDLQSNSGVNMSTTLVASQRSPLNTLPEDLIEQSVNLTGQYIKQNNMSGDSALSTGGSNAQALQQATLLINQQSFNGGFISTYGANKKADLDKTLNQSNPSDTKEILLRLLKECKRRVNDQVFLKNYITHRIDKREQRNNDVQNELKKNLESFQNWLSPISITKDSLRTSTQSNTLLKQTTGVRKALNEGVFALNNVNPATSMKTLLTKETNLLKYAAYNRTSASTQLGGSAENFKASLQKQNYYIEALSTLEKEAQIKQTLKSIKSLSANKSSLKSQLSSGLMTQNNKNVSAQSANIVKPISATVGAYKSFLASRVRQLATVLVKKTNILSARSEKNIEWWKQKQRVMTKRKSSRKKARFKNIKASVEQNTKAKQTFSFDLPGQNKLSNYQIPEGNLLSSTLRKKRNSVSIPSAVENTGVTTEGAIAGQNSIMRLQKEKQLTDGLKPKLLKNLFLKKFNSKRSSKGSRYRYMSNSRGFAYVRRPKNDSGALNNLFDSSTGGINTADDTNQFIYANAKQKKAVKTALKNILSTEGASKTTLASTKENILSIGVADKNLFVKDYIKKSPIQKRSKRAWKKRKRHKLTRNHYKYRKRNIHSFGKLRNLNKKFKRIKDIQELQNWWWNIYLPREAYNYIAEKNSNILVSKAGVDKTSLNSAVAGTATETGILKKEQGYKPLSTNKALEIREKLLKASSLQQKSGSSAQSFAELTEAPIVSVDSTRERVETNPQTSVALNVLDQIYSGILESKNGSAGSYAQPSVASSVEAQTQPQTYNTTNIPFYAGWDESLRKFVVTNRLLSRRDAGFRANLTNNLTNNYGRQSSLEPQSAASVEFTKAPIQGLNEGSFLYLQTEMPFNSYIIDQFIPTNQSFYAPLGWKRFQFRHSLLKNWQNFTKSSVTNSNNGFAAGQNQQLNECSANSCGEPTSVFVKHTSLLKYLNQSNSKGYAQGIKENKTLKILQNKRIKKRYKLLKQTPIQLMYVPTGALLNEVLPSHYVSVFDKQYRIPRNRYLKRYLPKANLTSGEQRSNIYGSLEDSKENLTVMGSDQKNGIKDLTILEYSNNLANFGKLNTPLDFTLRKKVKPRRKYHKKRFTKKDGLIFPRRQKFSYIIGGQQQFNSNTETNMQEFFRLRPSTKAKQTSYGTGAFTKSKSKKRLAKPVRLRQLRNREFKQVYKPLQRFQPRSGGFVWPGDYLRFEIFPMPKLNSLKATISTSYGTLGANQATTSTGVSGPSGQSPKAKAKRKINVQPIGLLPRKYLIQKHNLKVLKKKISLSLL